MKKNNLDRVLERTLGSLIVFAEANRGTYSELAKRLTKASGKIVYRQQIESWLAPDPARRMEPKLAMGLLLMHEGFRMMFGRVRWFNLADVMPPGPHSRK